MQVIITPKKEKSYLDKLSLKIGTWLHDRVSKKCRHWCPDKYDVAAVELKDAVVLVTTEWCKDCNIYLRTTVQTADNISTKKCGYCGKDPGFICFNNGVCLECCTGITKRLSSGNHRIPFNR